MLAGLAVLLVTSLSGCESGEGPPPIVMPDVTGTRLDVALSDIKHAGIDDEVEIVGGGLFGIQNESNWEVCEQSPLAGEPEDGAPRVIVERDCGFDQDDEVLESAAPKESSATPSQQTSPPSPPEVSTPSPKESVTAEPSPVQEAPSAVTAEKMEATLKENIQIEISELCGIDGLYSHWSCFYDGVEDGVGYLQVNLTTDGGWSNVELNDLAATAGLHWFNFIGCDYPDLDTIVVRVNGLDHNVFRSSTNVDLMCKLP